ncbi:hypothetical protein [Pedobacter ginsengisoli]|uniref:hypothetical protein n=1 Tax=Pedobacter ginsengisoli TaxID=363852 RepID=UPI00254F9001|nr:hypothetical protein [Pedobacter ginsengisoli]
MGIKKQLKPRFLQHTFLTGAICIHTLLAISSAARAQSKPAEIQIISDTRFQYGIGLIGESSAHPEIIDTLRPFGKQGSPTNKQIRPPIWKMPQWASRYNLKNTPSVQHGDTIIYQNQGKKVSFLTQGKETTISLEVFGSKEYLKPRIANEAWPHLLLEQRTNQMPIAKMKELDFRISARLLYSINKTGTAYDPGLHAAQVTFYLLIQNVNKASAGYSDYFWFGLPLYDSRHPILEEYAAQDLGKEDATKKFILNVASKEIYSGTLHDKKWINIHKDLYPLIKKAFQKAKDNGYLKTTTFEDIAIESTNLGWEIPGTFDSGIQFKNLKLSTEMQE